jgi:hypothetical protein
VMWTGLVWLRIGAGWRALVNSVLSLWVVGGKARWKVTARKTKTLVGG